VCWLGLGGSVAACRCLRHIAISTYSAHCSLLSALNSRAISVRCTCLIDISFVALRQASVSAVVRTLKGLATGFCLHVYAKPSVLGSEFGSHFVGVRVRHRKDEPSRSSGSR